MEEEVECEIPSDGGRYAGGDGLLSNPWVRGVGESSGSNGSRKLFDYQVEPEAELGHLAYGANDEQRSLPSS